MDILKQVWARWKIIGKVVADFQGRAIAMVFYWTVMVPFGLGLRTFGDPLGLKNQKTNPEWLNRDPVSEKLEDAWRQY